MAVTTDALAQGRAAKVRSGGASELPIVDHIALVADRDDDDLDGKPDAAVDVVAPAARVDAVVLEPRFAGAALFPLKGEEHARVLVGGRPLAWGEKIPPGALLQGVSAGRAVMTLRDARGHESGLALDVHGISLRDGQKKFVDFTADHASLERTAPTRIDEADPDEVVDDPDALRFVVTSPDGASLGPIELASYGADGNVIDTLAPHFSRLSCFGPEKTDVCFASAPIRLVADDVDRRHPLVAARSLKGEVGGAVVVRDANGRKLQAIRVAGPRRSSVGPIGRSKLAIRPVVMRLTPGGTPAIGGSDAGAFASIKQELTVAASTWGQCGITFGPPSALEVRVVSPPPPYLVAFGDDLGLPAAGGEIRFKIDGRAVHVGLKAGWSTRQAALELQRVATLAGFKAAISENARISDGATPSVDVLLRNAANQLASAEIVANDEPTMTVRVGSVDLGDGLQHFGDTDSVAGTLEERTLVKAVDDGDPRTVELIVVPFFGGGGRIGESFIGSDGSSMRNVVILDRAGVRARRSSLTLAHELGHVILDEPGHPDDYGIDMPTLLMDSDASDATPFGPRRITDEDCARAVRQSGPGGRIPLLSDWKLTPMRYGK